MNYPNLFLFISVFFSCLFANFQTRSFALCFNSDSNDGDSGRGDGGGGGCGSVATATHYKHTKDMGNKVEFQASTSLTTVVIIAKYTHTAQNTTTPHRKLTNVHCIAPKFDSRPYK